MTGELVKFEVEWILKKVAVPWTVVLSQSISGGTENVQHNFLGQPVHEPRYEPERLEYDAGILHTERRRFFYPKGLRLTTIDFDKDTASSGWNSNTQNSRKNFLDCKNRIVDGCLGSVGTNSDVINPYPTVFPYGNGMVLHFYQQQESSTTKTVHRVINKGLKAYV